MSETSVSHPHPASLGAAAFSPASLGSSHPVHAPLIANSVEAGWTSLLLEVRSSERNVVAFDTTPTPDQKIVVLLKGGLTIQSFRHGVWRRAPYRPGMTGMTAGGQTDRLQWTSRVGDATPELAHLFIPQQFFREAAEHYRRAGQRFVDEPLSALAFDDPVVAQATLALVRAMRSGAPDLYAETLTQWLAVHLLSKHSNWISPASPKEGETVSDRRIARVLEYMTAHVAEPLTLNDLAKEAGISKFHFAVRFRKSTGSTPYAFLLKMRMDLGRRLLATTGDHVDQVAAACGYTRAAHFSTAFLRFFGKSPSQMRRDLRGGL